MLQRLSLLFLLLITTNCFAQQNNDPEYKKAEKLFSEKKYSTALKIFEVLLKKDNKNTDLLCWKAGCLRELQQFDSAFYYYNKIIELEPNSPSSYVHRGCFYIVINRQDFAIKDFNEALKYAIEGDTIKYTILSDRSQAYFYLHDYESAYKDLKVLLAHDSAEIAYHAKMFATLVSMKRYDTALVYLDIWKRTHPNDLSVYQDYAFLYELTGEYQKAINLNTSLLQKKEYYSLRQYLYNNRGYEKLKLNDIDGAMKDINTSINIDSMNSYAYRNRALAYMAMYQNNNACKDLEKAIHLNFTVEYGDEVQQLMDKNCKK